MPPFCLSARPPAARPPAAGRPLLGPHDALAVVLAATCSPAPETVVLVLDRRHCGSVCLVIEGGVRVDALVTLLTSLARADPRVGALVVATTGCLSAQVGAEQELAWFEAREQLDALGVELLDWFLLTDRQAGSVAELTDSQWRWRSAPPW
jgi:hypothetical protein